MAATGPGRDEGDDPDGDDRALRTGVPPAPPPPAPVEPPGAPVEAEARPGAAAAPSGIGIAPAAMKGPARRLVDHKGRPWPLWLRRRRDPSAAADPRDKQNNVSFFGLWRYATWAERLATLLGVALSCASALCTLTAVSLYGELTALFVARHTARESGERAPILALFGGGRQLGAGDRPRHMDALVEDCVAFAWASAATMGAQVLVAAAAVTAANWAADNMTRRVRLRLLAAALAQEAAFYDTHSDLDYATVLSQDTEALRDGTGEHVVMTSYLCSYVLMAAAVSLWHGWLLTLVALAVVPVAVISAAIVAKIGSACASREAAAYACAGRGAQEALANVATVRAYAGEHVEVHRFDAALRPVSAAARRRFGAGAAGAALGWLSTYSMSALVLAVGASLCVRDMHLPPHQQEYHPGALVIILFSTFMCCQNITLVQPHVEVISLARGSARALQRLLGRAPAIDSSAPGVRPAGGAFRGEIAFRDVFFNYPARPDVKVLRGLTLAVAAGETVALVGASGCGKSTLLQLLQRAYEPDAGGVSVDGVPLHQLDLHHFRTSIGVVGQEPVLFSGTLRENIALGTEASLEDVIVAAKAAHAHQFIAKLPDGYETLVGERGAALSGGQKQRVAIARALLRKPAILLLDEPTSALDPVAERQVQAALDAASAGRTTLVVSHRLSTIVNASRIVYLEQGAVREQGTHQELMALRGAYFRLATAGDAAVDAASPASPAAAAVSEPSAPSLPAGVGADDDDVAAALDTVSDPPPLQRSFERRSTRASLASESGIRSSWRLGAPLAAPPAEPAPSPEPKSCECKESSSEEEVPPASGLALLRLSAREWPQLLGGGLAALLVGAAMPAFALLFSRIFGMFALSSGEEILQSSRLHAGLFALFALLCALSAAAQGWLLGLAGAKLTHRLRVLLLANYLRQEQAWFERPSNSVGALCARLAGDCAAVHGATGARLGTMLQGASTLLLGVALALPYSWSMTLVSLLSVPCVIGAIYAEGAVSRRSTAARRRALEQAAKVANEGISNVRTVHSLGVESMIVGRYGAALASGAALTRRAQLARGVAYGLCVSAPTLGYTVSLAYGGWLVARKGLQYDHAILVCEALIYGAWMLAEALSFAPSFAAAKRAGARILHALQREPTVATEPTARDDPQWRASGELTLSDVRFSYGGSPVLRGLSLRLAAGGSVALVGRSGCGKSTVLRLLLRAYDPDGGTLSMDGRDIRRDVPLPQLRAQLALVQQEPALFERSIRENIAYGDNSRLVPLEEVIDAATQANVHAFIASLPMGYDTVLSGGGSALSGGQKQRVAIARALLRKPRVLLLDEATSALDAASEKSVSEALRAAGQGRSTVAVAHRLATVAHVDTIALINNGVVEESGSHQELLALRGHYWRLWTEQGSH